MKIRKPGIVFALAAALVLVSAGGAYAYWTVSGSGNGTATVATIKPLVVNPIAITGMVLARPVKLSGKIQNPNDFEVSLKGTTLTVTGAVDKDHAGCTFKDNFTLEPGHLIPEQQHTTDNLIPAKGEVSFDKGYITLNNRENVNQIACQGATVTLAYDLH